MEPAATTAHPSSCMKHSADPAPWSSLTCTASSMSATDHNGKKRHHNGKTFATWAPELPSLGEHSQD